MPPALLRHPPPLPGHQSSSETTIERAARIFRRTPPPLSPRTSLRSRWPGGPTWPSFARTPRRFAMMVLATFMFGGALGFALQGGGAGREPPSTAVERAGGTSPPGSAALTATSEAAGALPERPDPPAKPSRAALARQLAFDAFLHKAPLDGVSYFRIAVRAQRRAPGDDVLILQTIAALGDRRAASAAGALLRQLGRDARPLLVQTARTHPDRLVQARARALLAAPSSRPFLRWSR